MSKFSTEDILALSVAAILAVISVESGCFHYACMALRHGTKYELGDYVGACLIFLVAAVIMLVRREWHLRALLGQSVVREQVAHNTARRDYLTGLPNRLALMEYLQSSQGVNIAFLLVDLDGFKEVNDAHGHAAGDAVLKIISERLLRICADLGGIVGRLGGDEFGYIITMSPGKSLTSITDHIIKDISEPVQLPTGRVSIGASVGSATSMNAQADPNSLLHGADLAMYRNKPRRHGDCPLCSSKAVIRKANPVPPRN
jgi:diguanylate cyclase (GGDEF)-like protein